MQRAITVVSIIALMLTALAVAGMTTLLLFGHSVFWVERGSGGTRLEQLVNFGPLLPIGVTLLAWALSLISAAYRHQWGWVALLLLVVPVGFVCWFDFLAVVELNLGVTLPLLLPLTTWLYARQACGSHAGHAGEAM